MEEKTRMVKEQIKQQWQDILEWQEVKLKDINCIIDHREKEILKIKEEIRTMRKEKEAAEEIVNELKEKVEEKTDA